VHRDGFGKRNPGAGRGCAGWWWLVAVLLEYSINFCELDPYSDRLAGKYFVLKSRVLSLALCDDEIRYLIKHRDVVVGASWIAQSGLAERETADRETLSRSE